MNYKDVLLQYEKKEEIVRLKQKKKKLARFELYTIQSNKRVYEDVSDEELATLEALEFKTLTAKTGSKNEITDRARIALIALRIISGIIGFLTPFVINYFGEINIYTGVVVVIIWFFIIALNLTFYSVIELLISLNK
jgi:hypothetical protein